MALWYRGGTISLTAGSTAVTGTGTLWLTQIKAGDALLAPDGRLYEVAAVGSSTALTLREPYAGAEVADASYAIIRISTLPAALAADVAELVRSWQVREDEMSEWMAGPVDGGPNGDGRYPLTDPAGVTRTVPGLAVIGELAGQVVPSATAAIEAAETATGARDEAVQARTDTLTARDLVLPARDQAVTARNEAVEARDQAVPARNEAVQARNEAVAAAAGVNLPPVAAADAGRALQVKGDGSGWELSGPLIGHRNAIHNGDFRVWQRGNFFNEASLGAGGRVADGWIAFPNAQFWAVERVQRPYTAADHPGGSAVVLRRAGTINAAFAFDQRIDDVRRWAGQTVTLSLSAYNLAASGGFTMQVYLSQVFGAGGSATVHHSATMLVPTGISRPSASFALSGIEGKTIGSGHSLYLSLQIPAAVGSLGSGADLTLWDVQLERGPAATPFDRRPPSVELAICRWYFRRYATAQNVNDLAYEMRATPSASGSGPYDYSAEL